MSHAGKPAAPDAVQRPPPASTAWVFDMLSEGTTYVSPEPGWNPAEAGVHQITPTLMLTGLLILLAALGYLL